MSIPFARYGYRDLAVFSAVLSVLTIGGGWMWWPAAIIFGVPLALVVWFFRDPPRSVPEGEGVVVSPADGTITDITEVENAEYIDGPAVRVGIFLSIFSVHVNRAPYAGKIDYIKYHKGKFISANKDKASSDNESNAIGMVLPDMANKKILVKQISGFIARRIVCDAGVGDELLRGEKFGMIKFGSRTELFVTKEIAFEASVKVGDKVRAGATILGHITEPSESETEN